MRYRRVATLADLTLMAEGWQAEIVDGKLEPKPMPCLEAGRATWYILTALGVYAQRTGSGSAVGDKVDFVVKMRNRKTFIPDASYSLNVDRERIRHGGAPSWVLEMRSDTDYGLPAERRIEWKRMQYFDAGTLMVWDVDVLREGFVKSYHKDAQEEPTVFTRGEWAHAEPVLPGFRVEIEDMIAFAFEKHCNLPWPER